MMVTFDICAGNPGALQFLMQAYDMDMFKAEQGFQRMQRAGITGARLYMLWNDCCNRDTEAALLAMNTLNIESVVEFINYEGGRGIPILFKHYLKLGGKIGAFHMDKAFNTLDAFLLMDLTQCPKNMLDRYMTSERATEFLARWK